jgi:CheY-like chemotaxis protein
MTDLDFTQHFDQGHKVPEPSHSAQEMKHIDDLGVIGETALKDKGFYARIISAVPAGRPRTPHETRVLVVEDNEATALVITKVLSKMGYPVRVARNRGELARELAALPDLILLDVMLPDINGFDVLNRVRQHPKLSHIPVLMLTSLSERSDIAKGLALGASGYVTKPALPSTLIDAVQAIVAG